MKVDMIINNETYTITLNDSQTAKDFYDLLPLDLTLEDHANNEKVANLPKSLGTGDSPAGVETLKGDVSKIRRIILEE